MIAIDDAKNGKKNATLYFFFSSPYTSGIEGLGGFILLDLLLYPVSALFQWRVSTFKMRDAAEFAIILT